MSLIQHALETAGIVTVSATVMPDLTRRLRPPRALAVSGGLGAPLAPAGDEAGQTRALVAMLAMASRLDVPVLEHLDA